jgi:predicted DCC family thiol-disulfide oxidoreductase YuxK
MASRTFALLFDADCGFCRWATDRILAWDRGRRLRPVALQDAEAGELLRGVPYERRVASWHLVSPEGRVYSAGAAVGPLLRLLPGGTPLAAFADAFPRTTARAYAAIARNRGRLGRLLARIRKDPGE